MPSTEYTVMCRDASTSNWTITYTLSEALKDFQRACECGIWQEVELIARDLISGAESIYRRWQAAEQHA